MDLTLEQALEVLNRRRHRGETEWHVVQHLRLVRVAPNYDMPSYTWLNEFEVLAIAEAYLHEEVKGEDTVDELFIFLCRGGGVELLGVRPEHGDRGTMMPMIAGDEARVAELREVAHAQMRQRIMSDFRLCRFVNVGTVEVIGRDWQLVE